MSARISARRRSAAAVTAALMLSACGSTVAQSRGSAGTVGVDPALGNGGQGLDPGAQDGSTTAGPSGTSSDELPGGGSTAGNAGPSLADGEAQTSDGSATAGPDRQASPSGPTARRGGPQKPVAVGFQWLDTSSGTQGIDPQGKIKLGDQVQQAKAVVQYINSRGGLAGRRIELVVHRTDYARTFTSKAAEIEAACSAFTEDKKVAFAVLYTNYTDLVRCLGKRGVVSFSNSYVSPRDVHDDSAHVSPGNMSYQRGHVGMIKALHARGFFASGRVGVLYAENPDYRPVVADVGSVLKSLGVPYQSFGYNDESAAAGSRDMNAAVLRFRQDGVTHVLPVDLGGGGTFVFMNSAENQQYRPKYALSSANNVLSLQQLGNPSQLANSSALGWRVGEADSEQAQATSGHNATGKTCVGIMRNAGVDVGTYTTSFSAQSICDSFLSMKAASDRAGAVGPAALPGVAGLGASYPSAMTFSTRFGPGRLDGATATRFLRWDRNCSCWQVDGRGPDL